MFYYFEFFYLVIYSFSKYFLNTCSSLRGFFNCQLYYLGYGPSFYCKKIHNSVVHTRETFISLTHIKAWQIGGLCFMTPFGVPGKWDTTCLRSGCCTWCHRLGGLINNRNLFFCSSGDSISQIRISAWLGSDEAFFWVTDCCILVSSHGGKKASELSGASPF